MRKMSKWLALSVMALPFFAPNAHADGILGSELASFVVLGASTVTNTGATTLTGNLGVAPGSAITGKETITINGTNAATSGNPFVHQGDAFATLAQAQLAIAKTDLGLLGPGTLLPANLTGLTLAPGIYTVPAGITNLAGTLTLNGGGNANAVWVFQMPSTLITSSGSVVNVVNTGSGAGVYWNVGSSATLGTTTSFEGNILALNSITLATGATDNCGRALANVGAVTMDTNTLSIGCTGILTGSNGLGGGLSVTTSPTGVTVVTPLPFSPAPVPEPATLLLVGSGIAGLAARIKRVRARERAALRSPALA